jgi:acetyl-CoA carboxylase carboxyltransferase component
VSDGPRVETTVVARSPVLGTVVQVSVQPGDRVAAGDALVVTESMKMEYVVSAELSGVVGQVDVSVGAQVAVGDPLVSVSPGVDPDAAARGVDGASRYVTDGQTTDGRNAAEAATDTGAANLRPELAEVLDRQARTLDAARPEAVARRLQAGRRTARMNIDDLCDPESFTEYGSLVVAAQRARRSLDDLIARTPADGLVAGIGRVNGDRFPDELSRCAVLSYDYLVLAGTQGQLNHRKKDRLFELVERLRLPVVLFAEGGGGRPGDTDNAVVTGLDTMAFALFGGLSGLVPTVGIASGRCFAGNAALLGCCDVIIATPDASIGMAGPAMIEGGGLGTFAPEEIGPIEVQSTNGVVDVVASDDADAVRVAKQYLSYFQGPIDDWDCADQLLLRQVVPRSRVRTYDMHGLVELVADTGSVLELRAGFGVGMVTALIRIEGRPLGVVANNPMHLGGAIDADGADKAARFLQLCDAHDLPVLFLCDTPGFMVGPEAEATAQVRHVSRMFVVGASLTVPFFTVVVRKGYGLGAQAMAGGSFRSPLFTVAWPTGELGGMGLEGAVRLGFRRELEAITDPDERESAFQSMVDRAYQHGRALNVASQFEIDDVIDPADTRRRVVEALRASPPPMPRSGKKRSCVDAW